MSDVICTKKLTEKYKVEGVCRCPRCNAEALPLFKKSVSVSVSVSEKKEDNENVLDRVRSGGVGWGVRRNIYPGIDDGGEEWRRNYEPENRRDEEPAKK